MRRVLRGTAPESAKRCRRQVETQLRQRGEELDIPAAASPAISDKGRALQVFDPYHTNYRLGRTAEEYMRRATLRSRAETPAGFPHALEVDIDTDPGVIHI